MRAKLRTESEIEVFVRAMKKIHGDYLPEGLLDKEQYAVYERYFGSPRRFLKWGEKVETEDNQYELHEMETESTIDIYDAEGNLIQMIDKSTQPVVDFRERVVDPEEPGIEPTPRNEAEARAFVRTSVERAVKAVAGNVKKAQEEEEDEDPEYPPEEEEDEFEEDEDDLPDDAIRGDGEPAYMRVHPLTRMGRFATLPYCIEPPEALTGPTNQFLADVNNKHLDQAAYKAFNDLRLSTSPIATIAKKNKSASFPIHPNDPGMTDMEANVHFATVMPGLHALALSALSELRRRLGRDWVLDDVNRILDVGTGGAGIVAWQGIVEAEEAANGPKVPSDPEAPEEEASVRATVVTASQSLRYRSAQMLDNTTFIPRLPDTQPRNVIPDPAETNKSQQPRKLYDLIIATNTLLPITEFHKRKYQVENLWSLLNPKGGILLLIEKGNPLGFEAIAAARSQILKHFISSPGSETTPNHREKGVNDPVNIVKEKGQIIAPCTNHEECPMYIEGPGLPKRRDFCRFKQRYTRPPYMQRIVQANKADHEDAEYSFVAVRRGKDARLPQGEKVIQPTLEDFDLTTTPVQTPHSEEALRAYYHTLPRVILNPFKKKGHVTFDVCTNQGKIERWTVPKSYGKQEYKDAKKSMWGDLWPLGAKTRIPRNIKVSSNRLDSLVVCTGTCWLTFNSDWET